jgi:hypothetical protein
VCLSLWRWRYSGTDPGPGSDRVLSCVIIPYSVPHRSLKECVDKLAPFPLHSVSLIYPIRYSAAAVTQLLFDSLQANHPPVSSHLSDDVRPKQWPAITRGHRPCAFKSFQPDTILGISGWTHQLLAIALRSPTILKALHTLIDFLTTGTAPG